MASMATIRAHIFRIFSGGISIIILAVLIFPYQLLAQGLTYIDPDGLYSFTLPYGWKQENKESLDGKYQDFSKYIKASFFSDKSELKINHDVFVSLNYLKELGINGDIPQDVLQNMLPGLNIVHGYVDYKNGYIFIEMVIQEKRVGTIYLFSQNEPIQLTFSSKKEDYESEEATYSEIIESFKFLNGDNTAAKNQSTPKVTDIDISSLQKIQKDGYSFYLPKHFSELKDATRLKEEGLNSLFLTDGAKKMISINEYSSGSKEYIAEKRILFSMSKMNEEELRKSSQLDLQKIGDESTIIEGVNIGVNYKRIEFSFKDSDKVIRLSLLGKNKLVQIGVAISKESTWTELDESFIQTFSFDNEGPFFATSSGESVNYSQENIGSQVEGIEKGKTKNFIIDFISILLGWVAIPGLIVYGLFFSSGSTMRRKNIRKAYDKFPGIRAFWYIVGGNLACFIGIILIRIFASGSFNSLVTFWINKNIGFNYFVGNIVLYFIIRFIFMKKLKNNQELNDTSEKQFH